MNATKQTHREHRLILFDLDNTLCDHFTSLHVRLHHAFQESFPQEHERAPVVQAAVEIAHDGTAHFVDVLAAHDIAEPDAVERAIERYQSDRFRGLELFEDALATIAAAGEQAQIAIITNGPTDIQQPKLDLLGIEHLFAFVLISESTGFWKPDPRIFELALERAGVSAHQAVYIGDSPDHDMAGAQAAGLTTIWMNRRNLPWPGGQEADFEAHNLREALAWLGIERQDT